MRIVHGRSLLGVAGLLLIWLTVGPLVATGMAANAGRGERSLPTHNLAPDSREVSPIATTGIPQGGVVESDDAILTLDGRSARLERYAGTDPLIVIDFGRVVSGRLQISTTSSSGAQLGIAMSESSKFMVKGSDFWGLEHGTYHWVPGAGSDAFESGQITFRYVMIFLEEEGFIEVDHVGVYFTAFLGTPDTYEGWFLSSDETLNRIWNAGAYTLELSTIEVADGLWTLVDGAKRDRHVWTGDLFLEARIEYLTHNNPALVRNALADLADHQRDDGYIPPSSFSNYGLVFYDYAAWWAQTFVEYVSRTGDTEFATTYYPHLQRLLAWFAAETDERGLVVDRSGNQWSFSLQRTGALTYLNAVYYKALRDAAALAAQLGETADSGIWNQTADRVRDAINEYLYDPDRGVYVVSDQDRDHVPQDGNALAVMYGIAPAERHGTILAYLREHLWTEFGATTVNPLYNNDAWHNGRIWPFMGYFELEARFKSGDDSSAFDLINREWGHMINEDPASTFWEWMTADGQIEVGFASLAHGWSAGPTASLSEWVLGVRQPEYFQRRLEIIPHTGELDWAQGRVPTAYGPIDIAWWRLEGSFIEHVVVPAGVTATVGVPATSPSIAVEVNGQLVWRAGQSLAYEARFHGGRILLELPAGEYDIIVRDNWPIYPETGEYVAPVFQQFWERNGGLAVFGYPVGPVKVEWNADSSGWSFVQYFERQRFEHHPANSGTPYEILLGRLGALDAERSGRSDILPAFDPVEPQSDSTDCWFFEETGHRLCGAFLDYWLQSGLELGDDGVSERESVALFGFPISEAYNDPETGVLTQFFERAVFEHFPAYTPPWNVLLRRLGADIYVNINELS